MQKRKRELDVAKNITDAEAIVIEVFSQLKDNHGMYGGIDTSYKYKRTSAERFFSPAILEEYKKPRDVKTMMLSGNIAYYKMPAVIVGSDTVQMRYWANRLTDSLCKLEQQLPAAYIIDLRMNNGGNIEPMWQALKGLIGEENKTIMVDAYGKIVPEDMDSASLLYRATAIPDRSCTFRKNMKVAVLVGPGTASSGEIIAASFTTRKQTRLFGERTIGVANVTQGFILQNKGYLLLTVAYIASKKKKPMTEGIIQPNEYVKSETDNYTHPEQDPTVLAALKWLTK
ncbi:MAG: S41 family peptidase [Chitinophagaceae bacterium]|nr:S41 family peptidase [Chitinophagaceae bacterium]